MKHTPGPWIINTLDGKLPAIRKVKNAPGEAPSYEASIVVDGGPPFFPICRLDFGYGKKVDQANARLIAAAPDLLEALQKISTIVVVGNKEQMENQIIFSKSTAYKAIRKVEP